MNTGFRQIGFTAPMLAMLIAGCVGGLPHELPSQYSLRADSAVGVVIGSVSAKPAPINPPWYEWSRYDFHSLTEPVIEGHVTSAFKWDPFYMWGSMPLCPDDGLGSECGFLFAMLLPAGDYEFHTVIPAMSSYATDHSFIPRGWRLPLKDYRFVVYPGQAVYIGNLLSRICVGGLNNENRILSAIGMVNDRFDRDIPLLIAKYPQLKGVNIRRQPVLASPWLWRYKAEEGLVPAHGWPPDCSLEPEQLEHYLNADGE